MEFNFLLAYSGGLDSHVLLSLMVELRKQQPIMLRAIHVHHGLSPNADAWAKHCESVCKSLNVNYLEKHIKVNSHAGSLEETARDARYAALADCLTEGEILLTAHHQDDQAETLLLQLMRGAGPKGLAAMPELKSFAKGWHLRPLLGFSREQLKAYAKAAQITWIEDESNANEKLSRNFIRQQVMPLLKSHWPAAQAAMSRSAQHCAESQALLEEYALSDYQKIKGSRPATLSVKGLLSLDAEKQRLMLRIWISERGYALPNSKKLASIQQTVLTAAPDRMPRVAWGSVEVRRYRDDLYIRCCEEPLGGGAEATMGDDYTMRFRQGGERLYIPKRGNLSLKNLFQEWGVPPWERDKVPLIYKDDELVGVVGFYEMNL